MKTTTLSLMCAGATLLAAAAAVTFDDPVWLARTELEAHRGQMAGLFDLAANLVGLGEGRAAQAEPATAQQPPTRHTTFAARAGAKRPAMPVPADCQSTLTPTTEVECKQFMVIGMNGCPAMEDSESAEFVGPVMEIAPPVCGEACTAWRLQIRTMPVVPVAPKSGSSVPAARSSSMRSVLRSRA